MRITRTSMFTGIRRTVELPITLLEYAAWERGTLIQVAMPNLTADEREFVMTGITADEWEAEFNRSQGEGDE